MKKTIIIIIIVLAIGGIAVFAYETRPTRVPVTATADIVDATKISIPTSPDELHYRLSQDDSTVSFSINEVLHGSPFTAVGTSNQVAGDVIINNATDAINVGTIKIDARTFKTDSTERDGAINHLILDTDTTANAYITFTPTKVHPPLAAIVPGKPFAFMVDGNLTVSGVTKPATLAFTATETATDLSGTVTTTIKRSDYDLKIPSIPFVANVSDTFAIKGMFVAKKV